jgi:hypothetical protein
MKPKKTIYRNFKHWWSTSKAHGMSSFSRDWMKQIWDDIFPTIEASQDDYKKAYIILMEEEKQRKSEIMDSLFKYIDINKKEDAPTFWRWYLDNTRDNK